MDHLSTRFYSYSHQLHTLLASNTTSNQLHIRFHSCTPYISYILHIMPTSWTVYNTYYSNFYSYTYPGNGKRKHYQFLHTLAWQTNFVFSRWSHLFGLTSSITFLIGRLAKIYMMRCVPAPIGCGMVSSPYHLWLSYFVYTIYMMYGTRTYGLYPPCDRTMGSTLCVRKLNFLMWTEKRHTWINSIMHSYENIHL